MLFIKKLNKLCCIFVHTHGIIQFQICELSMSIQMLTKTNNKTNVVLEAYEKRIACIWGSITCINYIMRILCAYWTCHQTVYEPNILLTLSIILNVQYNRTHCISQYSYAYHLDWICKYFDCSRQTFQRNNKKSVKTDLIQCFKGAISISSIVVRSIFLLWWIIIIGKIFQCGKSEPKLYKQIANRSMKLKWWLLCLHTTDCIQFVCPLFFFSSQFHYNRIAIKKIHHPKKICVQHVQFIWNGKIAFMDVYANKKNQYVYQLLIYWCWLFDLTAIGKQITHDLYIFFSNFYLITFRFDIIRSICIIYNLSIRSFIFILTLYILS